MAPAPETFPHAILLTGPPGVGKTTVVRRVAEGLAGRRVRGFTTEEIREGRARVGFRLKTFDGRSFVFARAGAHSPHRVGRYGVDVAALDAIAESVLSLSDAVEVYVMTRSGRWSVFRRGSSRRQRRFSIRASPWSRPLPPVEVA
ncbi:MAG: nucleoside-triphosphatase [Thermoanaerobaculia bacterium]